MSLKKTGRRVKYASGEKNRKHRKNRRQTIRRQTGSLLGLPFRLQRENISMLSCFLTYKYELTLMEPRESILVAAHNSLISEIRKNFLYKVGRSTLKLDEG